MDDQDRWGSPLMADRPRSAVIAGPWAPSRFNLPLELSGARTAVYNSFTGALLVLGRAAWRRYLAPGRRTARAGEPSATLRLLLANGLLVPEEVDELDLVRLRYRSEQFADSRLGVTLIPSLACNLRCDYCIQGSARAARPGSGWSPDCERDVVRYIAAAARGKQALDVCWLGGEPLLALDTVTRTGTLLRAACDRAGVRYSACLATNGTLLTPRAVARLRAGRLRFVQVTLDVPAGTKRDAGGHGTLERVLDRLVNAAAALPVRLRVNVVGDEEREFDRLYQGLLRRDLHAGLESMDFAPVLHPESAPRTCSFSALSYPDYVLTVRRERRKAMVLGVPMDGAREPEAPLACRATRRHDLVIGPDGLLYKCTNDVGRAGRAYGAVAPGAPAQPANLLPWLMHDCVQDERCARCPALPVCGGGCPHRRRFQPEEFAATGYCEAYLQELADRMQERVRSGGATVAGEQVGQASGRRPA